MSQDINKHHEKTNQAQQKQLTEQVKLNTQVKQIIEKDQKIGQQQIPIKKKQIETNNQEQMPDKFYDSDLASVNEKDFLSDNQPPKDVIQQRKLLHKQKTLHIYKTILRVGLGIDKPAPFDQIRLRFLQQIETNSQGIKKAKDLGFIEAGEFKIYNLGKKHSEIQRLVTSMRQYQISIFQIEELQVSKKSNIKVLKNKEVYVIQVQKWTTVIDIDDNKEILKYVLRKGEGPHRVSKYDQVTFETQISYKNILIKHQNYELLKIQQEVINNMQPIIWKMLLTMKKNQMSKINLSDENMKKIYLKFIRTSQQVNEDIKVGQKKEQIPQQNKYQQLIKLYNQKVQSKKQQQIQQKINQNKQWQIAVQVKNLISIDDIFMDGTVLKKLITKGVSTAKPESSSLIYYALKYLDQSKNVLYEDKCFNSHWWEDYGKLDLLGCRKNYLDEYEISKFLKCSMKRMKPAQISEIECRDLSLFTYGNDYEELQKFWPSPQIFPPKKVTMIVRVYNFTQGKNCFNMDIDEKVIQSKRKKTIAIKLLNQNKIEKAYKRFQNIVSFYNSGDINQDGYNEKISALMNSILCLMKQNKYAQIIPLCNIVLEKPKHGFNQDKMKINAQGIKVQGKANNNQQGIQLDTRELADLQQNQKIIDKCLYRKALALLKIGQSKKAIDCLQIIKDKSDQIKNLKDQAQKHLQNYQQKQKKMFKNMFQAS